MKKFYSLFLTLLALVFFSSEGFSQSGGTYTAIRSGNWHATSGLPIWQTVEPPQVCNNCLIILQHGITVNFNVIDTLSGSTVLQIGDDATSPTTLNIPFSNNNPNGVHNIMNIYQQSTVLIKLNNAQSVLSAGSTGQYDGINIIFYYGAYFNEMIFGNGASFNVTWPTQTWTGPSTFNAGSGILPIILSNFNASLSNNVVNLTWSTSVELNFSHFVIERSGDQTTWASIGTVQGHNAIAGANYSFTDNSPLHGNNYYRLRAVDLDGKSALSDIRFVKGSIITGLKFGPNPAVDNLGLTFGSDITSNVVVRLLNQNGQVVKEKQFSNVAGSTVLLPVSGYPSGIYTLNVKTTDGSQSSYNIVVAH